MMNATQTTSNMSKVVQVEIQVKQDKEGEIWLVVKGFSNSQWTTSFSGKKHYVLD